ncbi:hypothetical protein Lesp02_85540 [Lentzea sp. NBRC 105346]|uniref:AMP-binding protein n=1 Tax=Lentzea sp. NBRC 105346 TaxID=3032205 RepID=UPI0024A0736A|nr:AMP-binding protein [Lentzea sp. NBRC 105346]GLZ36367.1 hypothetical protein Lesp02_85540 [Lentzea sp. NBRC 105346]
MGDLVEALRAGALSLPDATAVRFLGHSSFTRASLDSRVRSVAASLQQQGAAGQRVLIVAPPGPSMFIRLLACLYAGAVAVPCRPGRLSTVEPLVDAMQVSFDGVSPSSWVQPSRSLDDVVLLQCPSGSTSSAKAVVVTAGQMLAQLESFRALVELEPGFSIVNWAPIDGTLGMELMLLGQYVGCDTTWIAPEDFTASPVRWLRAVSSASGPVLSGGPNFAYDLCVDRVDDLSGLDLSRWHTTLIGAERIRPSTVERFVSRFGAVGFRASSLMSCYGLTEVMQGIAGLRAPSPVSHDGHSWIPVGPPAPGARMLVVDPESGVRCADGVVGELWISGPMVCQGYWRRSSEEFNAVLASGEGPFLRTGDLGFVVDGSFVVCGRLKEIIILRGRNFYPEDVEQVAQRALGSSLPAAAFSVDSPSGELLVVVLESVDGDASAVRRAVIAAHGVEVHEVVLVAPGTIPRTTTGKVQRVACRQSYLDGSLVSLGGVVAPPLPSLEDTMPLREMVAGLTLELRSPVVGSEVRRRVAELLDNDSPAALPGDTPLMMLGLESVRMIALRHGIEEDFGVSLPIADFVVLSIDDVAGVIVKQLG